MELKESYLRTLEKVLLRLSETRNENSKVLTEEVKSMCGEYWESIKDYIKTHNVYGFASGLLWNPHKENITKCLTEVRLELDGLRQQKIEPRKDFVRQIAIQVLSTLIASAISFYMGILWEQYSNSPPVNTDKKTDHCDYQIGKDSICNQPSLEIR